jgi:site-specific DNA-methyltransferase (adenine-specific)
MKTLPDNSVDAIVTDPPYGISFMAKKWDYDVPKVDVWQEAMRVLKPGGHALIACGTRTQHRMVVNIEDAGFEIRDVVSWIYGSGFPKSLNISKAIDKAAGAEREVVGSRKLQGKARKMKGGNFLVHEDREETDSINITAPATDAAKQWDGWGTALKPACEFFTLARKPLSEKTVAANVLKWGTGGINIDGCRVGTETIKTCGGDKFPSVYGTYKTAEESTHQGRFPANLIHDGSQQVMDLFPESKSGVAVKKNLDGRTYNAHQEWGHKAKAGEDIGYGDKGSAARFFYCPKASKKDREEGNTHPTVKPTALMAYLCRLITPTGGTVLDPYMGSGSTGKAAVSEGFDFIGCELDEDYYKIATARINQQQQ